MKYLSFCFFKFLFIFFNKKGILFNRNTLMKGVILLFKLFFVLILDGIANRWLDFFTSTPYFTFSTRSWICKENVLENVGKMICLQNLGHHHWKFNPIFSSFGLFGSSSRLLLPPLPLPLPFPLKLIFMFFNMTW